MTACCPTCGQALPSAEIAVEGLLHLPTLTEQERRAVRLLIQTYPRPASRESLIDALWGDDPEGGPDDIAPRLRVVLHHIRRKIAAMGWMIPDARKGAGGVGQYRLVAKR